jgi:hypothetical protein
MILHLQKATHLARVVTCRLPKNCSVTTSLPNATAEQVTLGTALFSKYGMSLSGNNIVVPVAGIYLITGIVTYAPITATGILKIIIYYNGSPIWSSFSSNNAGVDVSANICQIVNANNASDTYGIYAYQTSGSTQTTVTGYGTSLSMAFQGSL